MTHARLSYPLISREGEVAGYASQLLTAPDAASLEAGIAAAMRIYPRDTLVTRCVETDTEAVRLAA